MSISVIMPCSKIEQGTWASNSLAKCYKAGRIQGSQFHRDPLSFIGKDLNLQTGIGTKVLSNLECSAEVSVLLCRESPQTTQIQEN